MLIHTRVEGHIDVPIEQAWAFIRDIHTLPMWHVMVVEAKDVVGTFDQVGSTGMLVLKAPDGLHDFRIEVTRVEPHRLVTHVGQQVDGPMRYTTTVQYVPAGPGFDWTWEQDNEIPSGQPGPLGNETFMARLMEQGIRQSAENHKLLLEAMVPQPA